MLLQLGSQQTETFSKEVARERQTIVQTLDESNFEVLLPKMSKTTPILIEKGRTLGRYQQLLQKTIKERDMVVLMKDCDVGDLHDYAAVSPGGKYVVIKNSLNGRRQELLVIGNGELSYENDVLQVEKKVKSPAEEEPKNTELWVEPATTDTKQAGIISISMVAEFIAKESIFEAEGEEHYWEHTTHVNFQQEVIDHPTFPSAPSWLNGKLKNSKMRAFMTVEVTLYATKTPRKKWIKFKLTDAVGMNARMGSEDNWARGFFNDSAQVNIFPGNGTDPDHSEMPLKWIRPSIEPHTPNATTKYTSTTGYSFGVSGGGSAAGPEANITASFSQSDQVERTMHDFSVRNISDQAMTGWDFYYTAAEGPERWKEHFSWDNSPLPIADLAKSTFTLNAEGIYQGPPDTSEIIPWNLKADFKWSVLRGNYANTWKYTKTAHFYNKQVTINMGEVKNPN